MEIKLFNDSYADEVSKMIVDNLLKVNSVDYPMSDMLEMAKEHTPEDVVKMAQSRYMVVSLQDGKITGVVSCSPMEDESQYLLSTFFILPELQGHGIGKALFEHIEDYARKQGAKQFIVSASLSSPIFYEKMGFEHICGKRESPNGENYPMVYNF